MEENVIGTAEIAEATGLSQRLVRYMAKARKIPWEATRPQKRGFWFERTRLEQSGWIREHTIDPSEPKRRGRKPKAAYTTLQSLAATRPAVLPARETIPAKELAEFSKMLAGKLKKIAPRLTLAGSRILYRALRPLERAIRDVAAQYIDDQISKIRKTPPPNNS